MLSLRLRYALVHLAAVLLIAFIALGEDVRLSQLRVGSDIYRNVTVTSVTATDIYFSHSRGFGNAKLKNLDPELQKRFHYNPAKAADKEKQQHAAQALYSTSVREIRIARSPKDTESTTVLKREPVYSGEEVVPYHISARSFLDQPTPGIEVEKWLTQKPDLGGKFMLLDFWATWSGPCRQAIPALNAFSHKFKDRLVVIGLSDEDEQTVRTMSNPRIEYFIAIDSQRRSLGAVQVKSLPHSMLIDPKGIVRFEGHPSSLDEKKLLALLTKYSE